MDEVLLASISRIPGVGRRKAQILVERFPTVEALRAASIEDIDALPGFGSALAKRLKEFAEAEIPKAASEAQAAPVDVAPAAGTETSPGDRDHRDLEVRAATAADKDWLKDFVEIAGLFDEVLPTPSSEPRDKPSESPPSEPPLAPTADKDRLKEAAHSLNLCPRCGALFGGGEETCSRCGVALVDASDRGDAAEPPARFREKRPSADQAMEVGRITDVSVGEGIGREGAMMPTGRVNGLAGAPGRVNGLASRVGPGSGMVNGLINGNGITNGHVRRHALGARGLRARRRYRGGIASIVLVMLIVSGIGTLLYTPPAQGGMVIDGLFGDWAGVARYDDTIGDSSLGLDLSEYRFQPVDESLLVYARVAGNLWGLPDAQTESVFAFVDEDGDSATGFQVGGIGAESAAEFYGWGANLMGSQAWQYDVASSPTSDDWRSFRDAGALESASAQNQIEARIVPGPTYNADRARVLFHTWSNSGQGDAGDAIVGRPIGALAVSQRTIAADILGGTQELILSLTLRPLAAAIHVASVTVREYGSLSSGSVLGSLYLDETADGGIDPTDPVVSTALFSPEGTFAVNRTLTSPESYVMRADFLALPPGASVGFRVVSVSLDEGVNLPVTIEDARISMSYVSSPPNDITVDGAFADWNGYVLGSDADDDVRSVSGSPLVNENIDLRAHQALVGTNVSVYFRVDGRVLGGVDIPNFRDRSSAPLAIDSDGDTVPNALEAGLGPSLAEDFNNDNVSDADQIEDVDQDGIPDYNKCYAPDCAGHTDFWLETTIPLWYPSPYGGKAVRRYVGPVSLPPQRGVDMAVVYMDRDNRTETGLSFQVEGIPHGMDFAYQAVGRGGSILEAGLYAYEESQSIPWKKIAEVPTGIDAQRLEASFSASLVNLTAERTFVFSTTDWRSNIDTGVSRGGLRGAPNPATRSSNDPRAFDIPGNQKLYLRNTDHGTETACTTNKVASSTPGPGPAASISLRAGQTACWYADGTAGTFIPAGDWETLLDLFLSHGIAVYGERLSATPKYRESDGQSFGAEFSAPLTAGDPSWIVVASSPTSPEKVVGILSSTLILYVQTWDGATWTSNWNTLLGDDQVRKFDIAYEETSGDVVVAFGDLTNQLKYRKRVGGIWDLADGNAGAPLADFPFFVRLTPSPTGDDVMAAASTNSDTLHALRWDGSTNTWGNQVQMSGTVGSKSEEAFDVVYERASSDAFVIWGNGGNSLMHREFTGTWGAETLAYTLPDKALWVTAAADRDVSSNRIAVGIVLNNNIFEFGAWTGASWVSRPSSTPVRDKGERSIDVGFELTTNRAIFAFSRNADPQQIAWRTWTQSGGFSTVTVEPGTVNNVNMVQLRPDPRSNAMMLLYSDSARDLWHRRWNGTAWSSLSASLETDLSEHSGLEAFMFAWTRVVEYDVYLEIWNKTTNAVVDTIGSCLDGQLYGDDVQCLVTNATARTLGVNDVVRVRIVHSSLGGAVGILFDAPSAGGDSRATIPSLIIVPEFETVVLPVFAVVFAIGLRRRFRRRTGPARAPSHAV